MAKIKIADLEEVSAVTETDYFIPVDNGSATYKIRVENYNASANTTAQGYAETAKTNAERAQQSASEARSIANEVSNNTSAAETAANEAEKNATIAKNSVQDLQTYVDQSAENAREAEQSSKNAEQYAGSVGSIAQLSKSWAVGGTGLRVDEETNCAKAYADKAKAFLTGVSSFNGRSGDVMPQKGDYTPEMLEITSDSELSTESTQPIQNKPVAEAINNLNDTIAEMKQSFQDGVDTLVAKLTALGITPASSSPDDIAAAIDSLATSKYNAGVAAADARVNTSSASYTSGRTQGQADVKASPGSYGLITKEMYDSYGDSKWAEGRTYGRNEVKANPNTYSLYSSSQYTSYGNSKYSEGYNKGVSDADGRANSNSANWKNGYSSGYNAGVSAADNRANSSSTNWKDGYNNGYAAGKNAINGSVSASTSWSGSVEGDWQGCKAGVYGSVTVTASISNGTLSVSASGSSTGQSWPWDSGSWSFPDSKKVECGRSISASNSKSVA